MQAHTAIKAARWRFRDVAALLQTASEPARLACSMETETIGVRLDDDLTALASDLRDGVRAALVQALVAGRLPDPPLCSSQRAPLERSRGFCGINLLSAY